VKRLGENSASNRKTGSIDCKSDPVFCVYVTIAFHDGNKQKESGALIYQALHLSKSLPFTDTSMKMGRLSVIGLLEKWRLRTKWAKTAVCP